MSVELAQAYVTIIPAFKQGIQKDITSEMTGIGSQAGDSAGLAMGNSMSAKLSGVLSKVALPAAIATAVIAVGKAAYELGETFDDMYDTIRVGTGATGEVFEGLKDDANEVLSTVPNTAQEVGQAIADLNTRLGVSGEELQGLARQYLEAGNILGSSVDISKTTAAFNAWNIEDYSAALDDLFTVSQQTGIGINELASSISSNAGAMQQLGFSFEETAAMAGMLDKVGIDASSTFSKMSKGLVSLAKDGEEPAEAFQRITGEMQSLIEEGRNAEALNLASDLFGAKGAAQFVAAMQSGALSTEELTAALQDNANAILDTAADTRDFADSWAILKNSLATVFEPLASGLFAGLGQTISEIVEYVRELAAEIGEHLAPLFSSINTEGFSIADLISGTLVPILKGFADVIGVIVLVIGTLVGWVVTGVSTIIEWFQQLPEKIADLPAKMLEIGRNIVQGIKNGIQERVSTIFDGLKNAISNGIKWIKNLLGISSPSKVFEWIGEMTVQGEIVGIEKMQGRLERTMVQSNVGLVGSLTPYEVASSSSSNVYINGARINDTPGIQTALVDFLYELNRLGVMQGEGA